MRTKITRRHFLQRIGMTAAATSLAACGAGTEGNAPAATTAPAATQAPAAAAAATTEAVTATTAAEPAAAAATTEAVTTTAATTAAETAAAGGVDWTVNYPPFEKFDPIKQFTSPRVAGSQKKFVGSDTLEHNAGDRLIEERLGIRFTSKYIASGNDEFREKLNLALAAGDLPDFIGVYPFDLYGQMVKAGVLKDLTNIWPQAASPFLQEVSNWSNGILWEPIRIDGKIYGFPGIKVIGQDEKLLWYRKDWLDKVGAKPPTTLDELHDVAKALVDAKVAGTDRPTIGLPLNNELNTWICSTDPIFGAYGVMPGYWKQNEDGTVVNYSTMPETREALALLNAWYKEGIIHQEFFTLDTGKSVEPIINGQAGMYFGPYWCPRWPNGDAAKNSPGAEWAFTLIPTGPKGRGTKFTLPVQSAHAIGAHVSDEDAIAIIKAVDWTEHLTNPKFLPETNWHGFEGYDYEFKDGKLALTPDIEPVGLPTSARVDVLVQLREYEYNEWLRQQPPESLDSYERALVEATFSGGGGQMYMDTYAAYKEGVKAVEEYAIRSAFNGIPTPTMIAEQGNLNDLERAAFIDIIVGNKPIESFDAFVQDWKSRGGDAIAREIGEYLAQKKA
jgi:putative aldouronate transport system substrate-binding protein